MLKVLRISLRRLQLIKVPFIHDYAHALSPQSASLVGVAKNYNSSRLFSVSTGVTSGVNPIKTVASRRPTNVNELFNYIKEEKLFYLKLLTNIFDTIDFATISNDNAILLLECCSSSVANSSNELRNNICQDIYTNILNSKNDLNVDFYHTYIRVCTENSFEINVKEFLQKIKCIPDDNVYYLLINNLGSKGNIEGAFDLLQIMKEKGVVINENVFNDLVLAHTIRGGLAFGEDVLKTMRAAQFTETNRTKLSLIKGVIIKGEYDEFLKALDKYSFPLAEMEVLEVVEVLGLEHKHAWIDKIAPLWKDLDISREFIAKLAKTCIHLVHMKQEESALAILDNFSKYFDRNKYGFFLLKEMLHINSDINLIVSAAKYFVESDLNESALSSITHVALKHGYVDAALVLLQQLDGLKPHYFWPLFVVKGKREGQNGVFEILTKMVDLNVNADFETLATYILPFCDLSNPKLIIQEFQERNLTVKNVLSPVVSTLLQRNETEKANLICTTYNVGIFGEMLLSKLSKAWINTKDIQSVVNILNRYFESNKLSTDDELGEFLIRILKSCKEPVDFKEYLKLIESIQSNNQLKISSVSADELNTLCNSCPDNEIKSKIRDDVDVLVNVHEKLDSNIIPHPRTMNVEELECHLIELKEKGMNTRGVIRMLIQLHTNAGNIQRVTELGSMFKELGFAESAGIKSSTFQNSVKNGNLEDAREIYAELKSQYPNFQLDAYKIIDYAKLLIENHHFDEALELLETEAKIQGSFRHQETFKRNCLNLLKACKSGDELQKIFDCLIKNKYAVINNVLLGPIVKMYLNSNDHEKAANFYIDCTKKYSCTPLQLELMCSVLKAGNVDLMKKIIAASETVHGKRFTHAHVLYALAENGNETLLRKALINTKLALNDLMTVRCERWIKEKKILPLQTLVKASHKLPNRLVDSNFVYECIMQIHYLNNDRKAAENLYESIANLDDLNTEDLLRKLRDKLDRFTVYKSEVVDK